MRQISEFFKKKEKFKRLVRLLYFIYHLKLTKETYRIIEANIIKFCLKISIVIEILYI
jgi:hypothetical protein